MIKTLVTLTIIVVIAAGTTWYYLGMPSFETATATPPAATADAAAPTETGSTAPASPVAP